MYFIFVVVGEKEFLELFQNLLNRIDFGSFLECFKVFRLDKIKNCLVWKIQVLNMLFW